MDTTQCSYFSGCFQSTHLERFCSCGKTETGRLKILQTGRPRPDPKQFCQRNVPENTSTK